MRQSNIKFILCAILGNTCFLVLLGCYMHRERTVANAARNDVLYVLNNYTQMRVEMTGFANSVAEYFYEKGNKTRNYYVLKPNDSDEFLVKKQFDLDNEKAVYLIGIPTSAGCAQSILDMCLSYDMRMLRDSMAFCEEDWSALSKTIQICYPELWSLWEKEILTAKSRHLSNEDQMISVHYIESSLAKSFRQMDDIFVGTKGDRPQTRGTAPAGNEKRKRGQTQN